MTRSKWSCSTSNPEKHEISLGIKQTEVNPWELVAERYPPGTIIEGQVRNLTNYGTFIEIEPGIDGLLHVSDMSWTEKISHANEKYKKGDAVECVVLDIDQNKQRVGLGVKQLTEDPWATAIPDAYKPGMVVHGTVTKITNFGVFVELEEGLEGLLHISELSDEKVEDPQDIVKPNDKVDVKILRVDTGDRKIGLSLKRAKWGDAQEEAANGRWSRFGRQDRHRHARTWRHGRSRSHGNGQDRVLIESLTCDSSEIRTARGTEAPRAVSPPHLNPDRRSSTEDDECQYRQEGELPSVACPFRECLHVHGMSPSSNSFLEADWHGALRHIEHARRRPTRREENPRSERK